MTQHNRETLLSLADRMIEFNHTVGRLAVSGLSPSGAAVAIALLVTVQGDLFQDAATALRATLDPTGEKA